MGIKLLISFVYNPYELKQIEDKKEINILDDSGLKYIYIINVRE